MGDVGGGTGKPVERRPRAVRLLFEYEGENVTLVSRQPVDMVPPPSDALDDFAGHKGFWAELRAADGSLVHRQVMHNPIRRDVEVFSDDPSQTISRAPAEKHAGAFAILVPDIVGVEHVSLVSSSLHEHTASSPAAEIARFALRESPPSGELGR
jgi:hypothetical protein